MRAWPAGNGCPKETEECTDKPLGATRVAYGELPDVVGHGTFVASIACGMDDIVMFDEGSGLTNVCRETSPLWTEVGEPKDKQYDKKCCEYCDYDMLPWYVARRDADGFQYGMGISPWGNFGGSAGGTVAGYSPFAHAQRTYLYNRARISNNSWGEVLVVGGNDGAYGGICQSFDVLVRDVLLTGEQNNPDLPAPFPMNQELSYVMAAGNDNGVNELGGFGDILVTPPATAKNVITVGSSQNVRDDCATLIPGEIRDTFNIAAFTSFGPTSDGRIKPEIVTPGGGVWGALTQYPQYLLPIPDWVRGCDPEKISCPAPNDCIDGACGTDTACGLPYPCYPLQRMGVGWPLYTCGSGTSYSAPQVAGATQLLWFWFIQRLLNEQNQHMLPPTPAMCRGYIINSARYLPLFNPQTGILDKLPSIAQGFGIMNIEHMFDNVPRVIRDQTTPRAIDTPLIYTNVVPQQTFFSNSGQNYEVSGRVADPTKPFRVTLTWSDSPGTPGFGRQLVNNLDLEVLIGTNQYLGNWFGREYSVYQKFDQTPDRVNNLECVFLPVGVTGIWTVVVRAQEINGMAVPHIQGATVGQDFALVVYNGEDSTDQPNYTTNNTPQTSIRIFDYPYAFTNQYTTSVNVGGTNTYKKVYPDSSAGWGGGHEFFKVAKPTVGTVFTVDTFGSDFDTLLSVWMGIPGSLVEVASNDDFDPVTLQSKLQFTVAEVSDYYITVQGRRDSLGNISQGKMILNVQATPPPIYFEPSPLDFGDVYIGTTSATVSVTFYNATPGKLDVYDAVIAGLNGSEFRIKGEKCAGTYLPSGASCTLDLQFVPGYPEGQKRANLLVFDSGTGGKRTLPLIGRSLIPVPFICASRVEFSFGAVGLGYTSTVQSVTISNCGYAAMVVTNVAVVGPAASQFVLTANSCTNSAIPVGGTCTLSLVFAPTVVGSATALLEFTSNAGGSPRTFPLEGGGVVATSQPCLSRSEIVFTPVGDGATGSVQNVTIRSCGTAPLVITGVQLTGTNANQFLISSDLCTGQTLPLTSNCTIGVRFAPQGSGNRTAELQIFDNAPGSPHIVVLRGTALGSQPDLHINKGKGKKGWVGVGLLTPPTPMSEQTFRQRSGRGKKKTFYVNIANLGNNADNFTIAGSVDQPGNYTVRYFIGAIPGDDKDITTLVQQGLYNSSMLAGGAVTGLATMLRVEVTADRAAPSGTNNITLTAVANVNLGRVDVVTAQTIVKK
jgi:hypothetical protein